MIQKEPNSVPESNRNNNYDRFISEIINSNQERAQKESGKNKLNEEKIFNKNYFSEKESKSYDKNLKIFKNYLVNPESEIINNHFDRFIDHTLIDSARDDHDFGRILDRLSRESTENIPLAPATPKYERKVFRSKHGLMAQVWPAVAETELTVKGQKVLENGSKFTRVDFTPSGRTEMIPERVTDSIVSGIKGLVELIAAIDAGEAELEPVFIGTTNVNMALISQRLGFRIVDADRRPDGSVDKSKAGFRVVGRLEDIRKKLSDFTQSGVYEKIMQRDVRLKLEPQTT